MADFTTLFKESNETSSTQRFSLQSIASRILSDPIFFDESTKIQYEKDKDINQKLWEAAETDPDITVEQLFSFKNKYTPRIEMCNKASLRTGDDESKAGDIHMYTDDEHGNVHYSGLLQCGSVWTCAVCAAKVADLRVKEINEGFLNWVDIGKAEGKNHTQLMVTFTIPHYSKHSISELRENFMKARRMLKKQDPLKRNPAFMPYKKIKENFGIQGVLSAIEVTWSPSNGWHPHSHDVFFIDHQITDDELFELESRLVTAWIYACNRAGVDITPTQEKNMRKVITTLKGERHETHHISVSVRRATTAEEYIAKFGKDVFNTHKELLNPSWGAAKELTLSHIKNNTTNGNRSKGYTPWDFLRYIRVFSKTADARKTYLKYGRLFAEYVKAFKGCSQLFWSKGFKTKLGLTSKTDIQMLTDSEIECINELSGLDPKTKESRQIEIQNSNKEHYGILPNILWKYVCYAGLRGHILYLARKLTFDDLLDFLDKHRYEQIKRGRHYERSKKKIPHRDYCPG